MTLEIAYDLVCPWCYLAHARVGKALTASGAAGKLPRWLPYQLTPDLATEGVDHAEFFANRVGKEEAKRIYAMMEHKTAEEGIPLDYSRIVKLPNTRKAHVLVELAPDLEVAGLLIGRLLRAHFADELDIGDTTTLIDIGASYDIAANEIRRALADNRLAAELQDVRSTLNRRGISGVPAFMVHDQVVAAGLPSVSELSRMISGIKA